VRLIPACLHYFALQLSSSPSAFLSTPSSPFIGAAMSASAAPGDDDASRVAVALALGDRKVELEGEQLQQAQSTAIGVLRSTTSSETQTNVCNAVTGWIKHHGLEQWPELLPALAQMEDKPATVAAALRALTSASRRSFQHPSMEKELLSLFPALRAALELQDAAGAAARMDALTAIRALASARQEAVLKRLDEALYTLGLSEQASGAERRAVCRIILVTLEHEWRPSHGALEMLLVALADADPSTATLAAECVTKVLDLGGGRWLLEPLLPRLIPTLLTNMRLAEKDFALMRKTDEENAAKEEKEKEGSEGEKADAAAAAEPHAAAGLAAPAVPVSAAAADAAAKPTGDAGAEHKDATDTASDADGGDDDDEANDEWTLRKASASAIDSLTVELHAERIVPVLLPLVQAQLSSADWLAVESAVLSVGAIAVSGGGEVLARQLRESGAWAKLLNLVGKPASNEAATAAEQENIRRVRSIACWTLGRLADSASALTEIELGDDATVMLQPLLRALLAQLTDSDPSLQHWVASALCTFVEALQEKFEPLVDETLAAVVALWQSPKCTFVGRRTLSDLMATLFDNVPSLAESSDHAARIVDLLLSRVAVLPPHRAEMPVCLETLSSVVQQLEGNASTVAPQVMDAALQVMTATIDSSASSSSPSRRGEQDALAEAVLCVSSLLDALSEVSVEAEALLETSADQLLPMLERCLGHPSTQVQENAFGVLGELARSCFSYVQPLLSRMVPLCVAALVKFDSSLPPSGAEEKEKKDGAEDERRFSMRVMANNACWALALLANEADLADMAPFLPPALDIVTRLLTRCMFARGSWATLRNILVLALSSLAVLDVEKVVADLPVAIWRQWIVCAQSSADADERQRMRRSLATAIRARPVPVLMKCFTEIADLVRLIDPPANGNNEEADEERDEELVALFVAALHEGKQQIGAARWSELLDECGEPRMRELDRDRL